MCLCEWGSAVFIQLSQLSQVMNRLPFPFFSPILYQLSVNDHPTACSHESKEIPSANTLGTSLLCVYACASLLSHD